MYHCHCPFLWISMGGPLCNVAIDIVEKNKLRKTHLLSYHQFYHFHGYSSPFTNMFLNAAFEGCRRTWVICDPIYWALSLMATTVNLQCFPIFEMQNKNCWSCPQKFYECIGAGGHELYKRATVNVNKSNRAFPFSKCIINCRKHFVGALVQEDMSYKSWANIGILSCKEQLLHSSEDQQYQHRPRVTITPNYPFSKWQIQRKLQRQIERQCQGQWQMDD